MHLLGTIELKPDPPSLTDGTLDDNVWSAANQSAGGRLDIFRYVSLSETIHLTPQKAIMWSEISDPMHTEDLPVSQLGVAGCVMYSVRTRPFK